MISRLQALLEKSVLNGHKQIEYAQDLKYVDAEIKALEIEGKKANDAGFKSHQQREIERI